MSREIPIILSGPMVLAAMKQTKTMTRRTRGLDIVNKDPNKWKVSSIMDSALDSKGGHVNAVSILFTNKKTGKQVCIKCPYGMPEDILWVREEFTQTKSVPVHGINSKWVYRSDGENPFAPKKAYWRRAMHMPKGACRLFLKITSIRIERLKSISEDDAKAEGIEWQKRPDVKPPYGWRNYQAKEESDRFICLFPSSSFETLYNSINGNKEFNKNPWVWVVSFKMIHNYQRHDAKSEFFKRLQENCDHSRGYITNTGNEPSKCITCGKPWGL